MIKLIKTNIFLVISIILAILIIGGALYFSKGDSSQTTIPKTGEEREEYANNVSVVDGKQIIEIKAKDGFSPEDSIAKAGIPTILRVSTSGTFDCSSSIRIPEMNISQSLPISGSTDIDIGIEKVGTFQGTCGMGMYRFDIDFQS